MKNANYWGLAMVHNSYPTKATRYPNKLTDASYAYAPGVFEVKSVGEDGQFAGYASVFNVIDSQQDSVLPGAFRASLKANSQPVQLLWQHQSDQPIGLIESLLEDKHGLFVRGRLLLAVTQAREAYALLKAGAIRGLSIGYQVKQARRDPQTGVRLLQELDLREVSLVTFPANEAAHVTVVKSDEPMRTEYFLDAIDRAGCALLG
jgi:HK97 family phage prohead protease